MNHATTVTPAPIQEALSLKLGYSSNQLIHEAILHTVGPQSTTRELVRSREAEYCPEDAASLWVYCMPLSRQQST